MRFLRENQRLAWDAIRENEITFLTGTPGTAKTFVATAYALKAVVELEEHKRVILLRPAVEAAGEKNGAIPGGVTEKINPFLKPVFDTIRKLTKDDHALHSYINSFVTVNAIGYCRGLTFDDCVVVVDEAQNLNMRMMRLILSRLGDNGKIIFCGDYRQSDIGKSSVLLSVANAMKDIEGISWFRFAEEDNVRRPLVNTMMHVLDAIESVTGSA